MKLSACWFLLLAAVYVKIEAITLPDKVLTRTWGPAPEWPNSKDIKYNRNTRQDWKNAWKLIRRQLILHMKKIAEEFATKNNATKDQLMGLLYVNREMFRYHWRTISAGIQHYIKKQPRDLSGQELQKFCDKYTLMMARALQLERFYAASLKYQPVPLSNRQYVDTLEAVGHVSLPHISLTGNIAMSYPENA